MAPFVQGALITNTLARYCIPAGEPITLDDDGYLPDPAGTFGHAFNPELVSLSELLREPDVALLGEPGIGKTTALRHIVELLRDREADLPVIDVDLLEVADRTSFDELVARPVKATLPPAGDLITDVSRQEARVTAAGASLSHVIGAAATPESAGSANPLRRIDTEFVASSVLILDGADQCPLDLRLLARWLTHLFGGLDHRSMQILIASRTADWPAVLQRDLATVHRVFKLFQLAPLSRTDVATFADGRGLDGSRFLEEVHAAGAAPLATIPITLLLIAALYERDLTLPPNTASLYDQGLLALADEPDPDRREAARRVGTVPITPAQRVAVASRIAGWLLLCGRTAVWRGPVVELPRSDIADGDFSGGSEPVPGGDVLIDADALAVTLGTAIFAGRGPQRLGVAHQSFASYLAARYLNARQLAQAQLRSLLVSFSESGTAAVHPAFRETAAWLVSLDHAAYRWLAEVDPEAIATYPIITKNPGVRELLVERLLEIAKDDALRSPFTIRCDHLGHPGLADQLRPVLRTGTEKQRRLAIRLAAMTDTEDVADDLIDLAFDVSLSDGIRSSAINAASEIRREHAAVRLLPLAVDPGDDPNDDIRGAAVAACWPEQMTAADLFAALTAPKREEYIGGYSLFLGELPSLLRDNDLAAALLWLADQPGTEPATTRHLRFQEMSDGVLAKAWGGPRRRELIPQMASVLSRRLATYSEDCLEFLGDQETVADEIDRRQLVDALLKLSTSDEQAWQIAHPGLAVGKRLIKPTDLEWLLEREVRADDDDARHLRVLIGAVFSITLPDHAELIWQYRESQAWVELEHWFRAVPLDSDQASGMRRSHERATRPRRREQDSVHRDVHIAELTSLICRAEAGEDQDAFWRLCYLMQVDPDTGVGHTWWNDDLTGRPGYHALPEPDRERLLGAADRYLNDAGPHEEDWLDNATVLDKRPVAGYLGLTLLDRQAPGLLDQLGPSVWRRWAPAMIWYDATSVNAGDPDRKRRLLTRLSSQAPEAAESIYLRYLHACSSAGRRAYELDFADSCWTEDLGDALASELPDLRTNDRENYELALRLLTRKAHPAGMAHARRALTTLTTGGDAESGRHVALILLSADPGLHWDLVFDAMRTNPAWGRELTITLSRNWELPPLLTALGEDDLAELYRWLAAEFPPESDVWIEGTHFVDTREQIQSWREQILDHLVNRGTATAVHAVAAIAKEQPQRPWLRRRLLDAEEHQRQLTWNPPSPAQLRRLVADPSLRYLRHEGDLQDVVAETIREIERDSLQGITPIARLLWDETRTTPPMTWRPKLEADLSDFLADQLRLRITRRGIIVNREVEIQRTSSYGVGKRVDLLVQAVNPTAGESDEPIALVIEVKGNWNDEILTAMRTQLADDYLPTLGTSYGIYLVGWFPPAQWDQTDQRRAKAARYDSDYLTEQLKLQAEQLKDNSDITILPVLLELGRP